MELLRWLEAHGHLSVWMSAGALGISAATLFMSLRDRRKKLRLQLLEGEYFFKADIRLVRGRVIVFNPASRSNCIDRWQLVVKDTENRTFDLACEPSTESDAQGNPFPVNTIPFTVPQGAGMAVDLYGFDYRAVLIGKDCKFIVIAEDIYGRRYQAELKYENRWPHELYKDDL